MSGPNLCVKRYVSELDHHTCEAQCQDCGDVFDTYYDDDYYFGYEKVPYKEHAGSCFWVKPK